jgi:hypothetical protein
MLLLLLDEAHEEFWSRDLRRRGELRRGSKETVAALHLILRRLQVF